MIDGVVTLKPVLLHPIAIIGAYGFMKFWKIMMKGLSLRHYQFIQIIFS